MRCPAYSFESASGMEFCGECGAPLKRSRDGSTGPCGMAWKKT